MLKWAAGTAAAGEAAVLGYTMVTGQDISFHGLMPSGVASAEPQRQSIRRELVIRRPISAAELSATGFC